MSYGPSPDLAEAYRLAREGAGWEDVKVKAGLNEHAARRLVFGDAAYRRWKAKQEMRDDVQLSAIFRSPT